MPTPVFLFICPYARPPCLQPSNLLFPSRSLVNWPGHLPLPMSFHIYSNLRLRLSRTKYTTQNSIHREDSPLPLSFKAAEKAVEKIPFIFSLHSHVGWTHLPNKIDFFHSLVGHAECPYSHECELWRVTGVTGRGIMAEERGYLGSCSCSLLVPSGPASSQFWM